MYTHRERERESISHASVLRKRTTVFSKKKKTNKKRMRESKLEHVKKTERVTLKHLRSKKEYDLSTHASAQVVLKEFFSRFFFVLNWFLVGEINLHISLASLFTL